MAGVQLPYFRILDFQKLLGRSINSRLNTHTGSQAAQQPLAGGASFGSDPSQFNAAAGLPSMAVASSWVPATLGLASESAPPLDYFQTGTPVYLPHQQV